VGETEWESLGTGLSGFVLVGLPVTLTQPQVRSCQHSDRTYCKTLPLTCAPDWYCIEGTNTIVQHTPDVFRPKNTSITAYSLLQVAESSAPGKPVSFSVDHYLQP